eukprot:TRINITY_DN9289_c0_g1_i1.p1 TRINITY_DN9289_c0_g1~~TRINITY_DN9289_c0_g1_i1.p1  ORF type:complete len:127 (+),score=14.39 TRINITY_DN9289_c0_g1_i1:281-661(+)
MRMATFSGFNALRTAILNRMRVRSQSTPLGFRVRLFCEGPKGTFLDKSEVTDRVISTIKAFQKVDPSKISPSSHFQKDLGLDSLDSVELLMALEEEFTFEIPDKDADKIESVNQVIDYIASHPEAK